MTSLLVSPKSLHQLKLGGLERGLGIAFLPQIARSLLRNGNFRGCGAGLVGAKQASDLPAFLPHVARSLLRGGGWSGF